MREYCNPINIEYKFQHYGKIASREAADPTLVYFKNKYYLFASMSAGFYYSDNMVDWKWHENRKLDMYRYAPDARVHGDYLYFTASSRKKSRIWRTKDPLSDEFEKISEPFAYWDPNLFFDSETNKCFLYWGCGNEPLYGIEMDTMSMKPLGQKVKIMQENVAEHGWERTKCDYLQDLPRKGLLMKVVEPLVNPKGLPYIEGSFLTKIGKKYYFQYAAPGTERETYGDGVYVSEESPLKGFLYQRHNPFSFIPSGFITGAGHGSTIEDSYGNLWHASTMRISQNQNFERRVGLFPAGVDDDGILFCNQNYASYPVEIPEGRFDPLTLKPKHMLLSFQKKAKASSTRAGHGVELAMNEDIRNWWCANGSAGEWYEIDLGKRYLCHSIQLNLAEEEIPVQKYPKKECAHDISSSFRYVDSSQELRTRFYIEGSLNGEEWEMIYDASKTNTDRTHEYILLPEKCYMRYFRVTAVELPYDQKFAISGFRVFGLDIDGKAPTESTVLTSKRLGSLDACVLWKSQSDAIGYNVRYGIAPDKLYNSYLLYGQNKVYLTSLNKGETYWCAVDSFNERGITEGKVVQIT